MTIEAGVYMHQSGGLYTVLFLAEDSTNGRAAGDGSQPLAVVYVSHAYGHICVRDIGEFTEEVEWPDGQRRPRFVRSSPERRPR